MTGKTAEEIQERVDDLKVLLASMESTVKEAVAKLQHIWVSLLLDRQSIITQLHERLNGWIDDPREALAVVEEMARTYRDLIKDEERFSGGNE